MEEVTKQSRKANYNNSKIFILEPKTQHPKEDIFYSSTTQSLFKRLSQYKKTHLKKNTSYKWLFEKYGIDDIKIVLIKSFSCNTKEELQAGEAKYIRENDCINKQEIKQDTEQIKEIKEEIKQDKEQIKESKEENKHDDNKTKKLRDKEYYNKNKDAILKRRRDKRQANNKQEEEILLLKEKS
jgi:hypothetical protein